MVLMVQIRNVGTGRLEYWRMPDNHLGRCDDVLVQYLILDKPCLICSFRILEEVVGMF